MERMLEKILPIMDVEHDSILSKQGDMSVVFKVTLSEIFTQSDDNYEALHQAFIKAIKLLPNHSVLHKQDYFTGRKYTPDFEKSDSSFLTRSSDRFFNERPFLEHECYVILTKKASDRKLGSSVLSNLLRPTLVPEQTISQTARQDFQDSAGQFARILSDAGIKMERLKANQIVSSTNKVGLIEKYCTLSTNPDELLVRDMQLKDGLRIGNRHCQLYTLADAADLPALCGSRINYDKYSTDRTKFSIGFASTLGLLLPCNHVYNQYVFIGDTTQTMKKLESKRLRLQSLAAYSRENAIARDAVGDF